MGDKGNIVQMYRLDDAAYVLEREPKALLWLLNEAAPDLA